MATPAVRYLREQLPTGAELAIACRENLAPFWENLDFVDEVIALPRKASVWSIGRQMRRSSARHPDVVIALPNSPRSALEARISGARRVFGYRRGRHILVPAGIGEPDTSVIGPHHSARYLHLVRRFLGEELLKKADFEKGYDGSRAIPAPVDEGSAQIALCPGAEYGNAKRYPIERYAEACNQVDRENRSRAHRWKIVGSPAEASLGDELARAIEGDIENLAGKTDIAGLVEVLLSSDLLVSNDTGTMHLGAALGVPTIGIFGSTEPDFTRPLGSWTRIIREKPHCSPCFLRECPTDYRCMLAIPSARLTHSINEFFAEREDSPGGGS